MTPGSLDYDRLVEDYDRRYRGDRWRGAERVIERTVWQRNPRRALEVGCGTGHWLQLAPSAPLLFGLDRSLRMLDRAAGKVPAALLAQAEAGRLPLAAGSFDAILCINALHHFADPQHFLAQCDRMLASGGALLLMGFDAHDPDIEWYLYQYFNGVRAADQRRYPRFDRLESWLADLGLAVADAGLAQTIEHAYIGADVLAEPFLEQSSTSQLALLSLAEYEQGLQALERAVRSHPEREHRVRLKLRFLLAERR